MCQENAQNFFFFLSFGWRWKNLHYCISHLILHFVLGRWKTAIKKQRNCVKLKGLCFAHGLTKFCTNTVCFLHFICRHLIIGYMFLKISYRSSLRSHRCCIMQVSCKYHIERVSSENLHKGKVTAKYFRWF